MEGQYKTQMPTVAIVGRPNVGKSFLFNRLAGKAISLVDSEPGVTRDRIYAEVKWKGKIFNLIDTGGFYPGGGGVFSKVEKQVEFSIKEADLIVLVLDVRDGVTALDEDIAQKLHKTEKTVILAINKADNLSLMKEVSEFYRLAFGDPISISALHGLNTDTLLDRIVSLLPHTEAKYGWGKIWISVVGRPNVGKSSFINAVLKDDRVIVDKYPGTTRGIIPVPFVFEDRAFTLLDTSGLRRRHRVSTILEKKMAVWTRRIIRRSHVSILLLDIQEGITTQDARIIDYICKNGRCMIIAFNKIDLIDGDEHSRERYLSALYTRVPLTRFYPVFFISALLGQNVFEVISSVRIVSDHSRMRIKTHILNEVIEETLKTHELSSPKGPRLKILYVTQVDIEPPTFVFFVNDTHLVKESYKRYLMRVIYTHFDFIGTPIRIFFKKRR